MSLNNKNNTVCNYTYRSKYCKYNSINTRCSSETLDKSYKNSTSSKDYFSLYKKYKNKYLNLKQKAGSSNTKEDLEDWEKELENMEPIEVNQEVINTIVEQGKKKEELSKKKHSNSAIRKEKQEEPQFIFPMPKQGSFFPNPVVIIIFDDYELELYQDELDHIMTKEGPLKHIFEMSLEENYAETQEIPKVNLKFLMDKEYFVRIINMLKTGKADYDTSIKYNKFKIKKTDEYLLFDIPDPRIKLNVESNNQYVGLDFFFYDFLKNKKDFKLKDRLSTNLGIVNQERIIFTFNGQIIGDILIKDIQSQPFSKNIVDVNIQDLIPVVSEKIIVKKLDLSQAISQNDALRIIEYFKTGNYDYDNKITYGSYPKDTTGKLIYNDSLFSDNRVIWSGKKTDATVFAKMNFRNNTINKEFMNIFINKLSKEVDISDSTSKRINNEDRKLRKYVDKYTMKPNKKNRKQDKLYYDYYDDYQDYQEEDYQEEEDKFSRLIADYVTELEKSDKKPSSKNKWADYDYDYHMDHYSKELIYNKYFENYNKTYFPQDIFNQLTNDEKKFLIHLPNLRNIYILTSQQQREIFN